MKDFVQDFKKQDVIDIEDDDLKDIEKLKPSSFINICILRAVKSETKDAMALEVDKLETILKSNGKLPVDYPEKLKALSSDVSKPYVWLKFELLLFYLWKKAPQDVEGVL